MEIKCDLSVARTLCSRERAEYLRTILTLMKQSDRKHRIPFAAAALFKNDAEAEIKERFEAVMAYSVNQHHLVINAIFVGVFTVLLIASYTVLPQPKFEAPSSEKTGRIEFDNTNAYVLRDNNGLYWICIADTEPIQIPIKEAEFYQQTGLEVVKE